MKAIRLTALGLALLAAGSIGGILALNLIQQTGRAQGSGDADEWYDGSGGQWLPPPPWPRTQVWCEVIFGQIDTGELNELQADEDAPITATGEKALLNAEQKQELLRRLRAKPSFELLGTASVITQSGQQAVIEMAEEIQYPTEYEEPEKGASGAPYCLPGNFESRNVGLRLNVTPTVGRDDKLVTLVFLPEMSSLAGWLSPAPARIEDQPIFLSWMLVTTVYLHDGSTVVAVSTPTRAFAERTAVPPVKTLENTGQKSAILMLSAKIISSPGDERNAIEGESQ